ncbi:hypothetical protein GJAV_G00241030 [Gymnothorax javanicus]|nr:hypothetical protein GJAV_G00241030 [Gymnothorax javanicus]
MVEISRSLLLIVLLTKVGANRVYVHPFGLFALGNGSCVNTQDPEVRTLQTVSLTPFTDGTEPDPAYTDEEQKGDVTQTTSVLAQLLNFLGQRLYSTLRAQKAPNTLLSPVNAYGTLVTFYLGAWGATAIQLQELLGLARETGAVDCLSPFDGHKVLRTLRDINGFIDGTADELQTETWVFSGANLSESFVRGVREFSDTSFSRAADLSEALHAPSPLNAFMEQTSAQKTNLRFQEGNSTDDLLFASSVHYKAKWKTMFKQEATSPQEFWINDNTSVTVPFMTHVGKHSYLEDKSRQCSVLKLALTSNAYMLLVLPNVGVNLDTIEDMLIVHISEWSQHLKEGLLEVSLPKLSLNAVSDLQRILSDMRLPSLLGPGANFSHFSRKENFTVGEALNEVVLEMSEDGSEQPLTLQSGEAAMTLRVDRPFCFAVVEGSSNAVLLMGRIGNPQN